MRKAISVILLVSILLNATSVVAAEKICNKPNSLFQCQKTRIG